MSKNGETQSCPHCGYDSRGNVGSTCPECGGRANAVVPVNTRTHTMVAALLPWSPLLISAPSLFTGKESVTGALLALSMPLAFIATIIIVLAAIRRAQEDKNNGRGLALDMLLLAGAWGSVVAAYFLIPLSGILDV